MSATSWNDDEEAALMYLSHRAQVLYLRGLRRFMDYSSGIVGVRRRVSLQQMRECLECNPDKSSKDPRYQPTNHEIRASLAELERHGLIEKLPKVYKLDPMLFFLPLASIRSNKEPQENRKGGTARCDLGDSTTCGDRTAKEPQRMNRIPPVTGKDKTPVILAHALMLDTAEVVTDRSEWGRVLAELGFRQEQILSAKNLSMLGAWVDQKLTRAELKSAIEVAHARNNGMPANVAYYAWSVNEIIKQRGCDARAGGKHGQGSKFRESGASVLARGCASAFEPD